MNRKSGSQSGFLRVALTLVISLAVLFVALWAAAWGVAAYETGRIRESVDSALQTGRYPDDHLYRDSVERLRLALRLNPLSAEPHVLLGQLERLRASLLPAWTPEARSRYVDASAQYLLAIQRRPSGALAWAALAAARSEEPDLDQKFFSAFSNALSLGPWEPAAQDVFFRVGMRHWDRLSADQQVAFRHIVAGTLRFDIRDQYLIDTAVYYGWERQLWPLLVRDGQRHSWRESLRRRDAGSR